MISPDSRGCGSSAGGSTASQPIVTLPGFVVGCDGGGGAAGSAGDGSSAGGSTASQPIVRLPGFVVGCDGGSSTGPLSTGTRIFIEGCASIAAITGPDSTPI